MQYPTTTPGLPKHLRKSCNTPAVHVTPQSQRGFIAVPASEQAPHKHATPYPSGNRNLEEQFFNLDNP